MNKIITKHYFYRYFIVIVSIFVMTINVLFLSACSNDEDDLRKQAIEHENYLLAQMQTIENKYQITNRNQEEITLQNYSLDRVAIYDKNGVEVGGFLIDNHTVYHNWYEIEKNDSGILNVVFETVDREEDKNTLANNLPYIIHDRAMSIDLAPYKTLSFASANGDNETRNASYTTENSDKIKYEVKTNVYEFETTRILNVVKGDWNSTHTLQFCTYEIQIVRVVFDDTTYTSGIIMEYRFTAQGTVSTLYDEIFNSYE